MVAACHTSCWLGVDGDRSGKELGAGAFAAAWFVAPVVTQERDYCAGCGCGVEDGPDLEAGGDAGRTVPGARAPWIKRDDGVEGQLPGKPKACMYNLILSQYAMLMKWRCSRDVELRCMR